MTGTYALGSMDVAGAMALARAVRAAMAGPHGPPKPHGPSTTACGPTAPEALRNWAAAMGGHAGPRTRRGPHGQAGWPGFGPPPPFGPPWAAGPGRGWRGPKARRGDVRAAILGVLADASLNGYQIIQDIAERSDGAWKPSPGSVYPTLQQLEDEGLVAAEAGEGRRVFTLTEAGRAYVAEHADEIAAPWQAFEGAGETDDALKPLIGQVAAAVWQLVAVGTPEQQARGREALTELRRRLYAILAEDENHERDQS